MRRIKILRHRALVAFTMTLLLVAGLIVPGSVRAQQLTLSITPPLVESVIKPGKSIVVAYTISNLGDPVVLSADVRPFAPQGVRGDVVIQDEFEGPIRFNLENSNIALGDKFLLQPREGQQLLLKIRVPEGTPEGDYYYTFYVQNDLGKPIEGIDAAQSQAIVGTHILLTVTESGNVDIAGSIGNFTVDPPYSLTLFGQEINIFESTDVIPVELMLQNTGRNVIKPDGDITLRGSLGESARFEVLPQNILSQSARLVSATPSAELRPSDVSSLSPASLYLKGFYVGKYTLTADINFGQGTESQILTTSFYALPFKLILATGVALFVGVIIVKKVRQDEDEE